MQSKDNLVSLIEFLLEAEKELKDKEPRKPGEPHIVFDCKGNAITL